MKFPGTEFESLNMEIAESVKELHNNAASCQHLMAYLNDEQRHYSSTIKNKK